MPLLFASICLDKLRYGTVVSPLNILGEVARRKLARPPVIGNAFTANTFSGAGLIRAVTVGFVLLDLALLHFRYLFEDRPVNRSWDDDEAAGAARWAQ